MRRVLGGTLALLLALGLAACAPADDPEPTPTALTGEQSERLAIARFRNFDAGVRAIEARIPSTSGDLIVSGWFDYANVAGYAGVTVDEVPSGLVWWNHDLVATRDVPVDEAPLPRPEDGWVSAGLDPSSTPLANALALVASLGADRPENPQLLAQSDAAWIRADEIGGTAVDVFLGPSGDAATSAPLPETQRARYWIDATGLLLRFEFPQASDWLVIDFSPGDDVQIAPDLPGAP